MLESPYRDAGVKPDVGAGRRPLELACRVDQAPENEGVRLGIFGGGMFSSVAVARSCSTYVVGMGAIITYRCSATSVHLSAGTRLFPERRSDA